MHNKVAGFLHGTAIYWFRAFRFVLVLAAPLGCQADEVSRIVIPYGPGPGLDAVARILAKQLALVQGKGVIVENRPGAGTVIGTELVYQSKPDGKTLLLNGSALSIGAARNLFSFNPLVGLSPVIQISDADSFLLGHSGLPATSLDELVVLSKSRRLNCGAVSGQYEIACRQLHVLMGGDQAVIVYKGLGEAATALMSGEVDVMFASRSMLNPMLPTGRVRVIAAATASRAEAPFGDLPLLNDRWPGFVLSGLVGLYATRDTPEQTIQNLNQQLNQVLGHPEVKQSFKSLGVMPVGGSTRQLSQRLAQDIQFFSKRLDEDKAWKP